MTGTSVVNRAYGMVGDVGNTKRNPLGDMAEFLTDGVRDVFDRRPHLRLQTNGTLSAAIADITPGNLGDELPVPDAMREGLAHYVAYRVFQIDAEDEANARSAAVHQSEYIRMT